MAARGSSRKPHPKQSTLTFGSKPITTHSTKTLPLPKVIKHLTPDIPQTTSKHKSDASRVSLTSVNHGRPTESELWVEKYAPQTPEDLAVHKQKIEQVSRWLITSFSDHRGQSISNRILALTGPSGAGKTATITTLARSMDIQIVEWKSGLDDWRIGDAEDGSDDRVSLSRKFEYYLTRGNDYASLSFGSPNTSARPRKRLLLIDDIPNIQSYAIKEAFHTALQRFVEYPGSAGCPLVIIISDAGSRAEMNQSDGNSWRSKQQDTVDFRSVFPKSLQTSPSVEQITFNPVATTMLRRGMLAVLTRHFGPKGSPFTKELIDMMLEGARGDLRSAIMMLQFADTGPTSSLSAPRRKEDRTRRETAARVLMETVSQREQSLQLFHLLGKLLYNKRYGDSAQDDAADGPPPVRNECPDHLLNESREPSKVDLLAMYDDSPIDSSLLSLYLHQNYHSFCNEIEQADALCDWLSLTDRYLSSDSNVMSEYAFHIASAGTLHSLPTPVPRRNQKLTKPEYFDVLERTKKAKEEAAAVRNWLFDRHHEWLYPQFVIETEFAAVVTCGAVANREARTAALTCEAFTSFPEITRLQKNTTSVNGGYPDSDMANDNQFEHATSQIDTDRHKGWLSDDSIDEWL